MKRFRQQDFDRNRRHFATNGGTKHELRHFDVAKDSFGLQKLIAFNFPDVAVLSLNEIPNEIAIESIGNIEI